MTLVDKLLKSQEEILEVEFKAIQSEGVLTGQFFMLKKSDFGKLETRRVINVRDGIRYIDTAGMPTVEGWM